jgi:hypothetical protein
VPPAHPLCRCRIVPERAIEHGIITRTARFSRTQGRARLTSRLDDLVARHTTPGWMDSEVDKGWSQALHPRSASGKFIVAGAVVGAVAARELADLRRIQLQTKQGYAVSSGFVPRKRYRTIRGISDAPAGTVITQANHPEGTYLVSSAALRNYRFSPARRPEGHMEHLTEAMRRQGFTQPIQMRIYSGDSPRAAEVWDGHHRLSVADQLGIKAVPATVVHVDELPFRPTKVLHVWRITHQRWHGRTLAHAAVTGQTKEA